MNAHVTAARVTTNPTSLAYFARAGPYLRRNHRIALRSEIVRDLIGEPSGKRILDLGCGNGAISLPYAKSNAIVLVDNSAAMREAARHTAAELAVTSYTALKADASSVEAEPADIVLAIGVLAHVDDPAAILAAAARNLKGGGLLVLQLSDAERPLNRLRTCSFACAGAITARPGAPTSWQWPGRTGWSWSASAAICSSFRGCRGCLAARSCGTTGSSAGTPRWRGRASILCCSCKSADGAPIRCAASPACWGKGRLIHS